MSEQAVAELLQIARMAAGLPQSALAVKATVSVDTVQRLEQE